MNKHLALLGGLGVILISGCATAPVSEKAPAPAATPAAESIATPEATPVAITEAVIQTNKGEIVFRFYPQDAPKTVENFITLAQKGFYDNLKWHRVVPNFVIQGGDPQGTGMGGPGYTIKAEFNSQRHLEGTVAMARANDPDSAGSQFYICLAPQPFLDGKYTVFGQVTSGMDVVKAIRVGDVMTKVTVR